MYLWQALQTLATLIVVVALRLTAALLCLRQMLDGHGSTLPISISLNAQQFTPLATGLLLYESPILAFSSPACGPVQGGTSVVVVGEQLRGGSDYRCRFGEAEQPANYSSTLQGDLVRCDAPRASTAFNWTEAEADAIAITKAAALTLTLNGQQHMASTSQPSFTYYAAPRAPAIVEANEGRGGTVVRLFGGGLRGGCSYRCRFGIVGTVVGSYNRETSVLRCTAPPASGHQVVPLSLSLNGAQYISSNRSFTWN